MRISVTVESKFYLILLKTSPSLLLQNLLSIIHLLEYFNSRKPRSKIFLSIFSSSLTRVNKFEMEKTLKKVSFCHCYWRIKNSSSSSIISWSVLIFILILSQKKSFHAWVKVEFRFCFNCNQIRWDNNDSATTFWEKVFPPPPSLVWISFIIHLMFFGVDFSMFFLYS